MQNDHKKWLMDSGNTVHVTNSRSYLFNICRCNRTVIVGNGNSIRAEFKGPVVLRQQMTNKYIELNEVL